MAKRVLLTGASGFVGANLLRRLISDGHEVTLLVRQGHQVWRLPNLDPSAVHQVDFGDPDAIDAAARSARPEWAFHLAAYGAYPSQENWPEMLATNLAGTANIVNACVRSGVESFVNAGSSSEYGFKDHAPPETEVLEPNSNYAVTKAAATMYCTATARARSVRIRTVRLYSVYGPWEDPTRLMPTLIVAGLNKTLPPLADRRIARDFIFVDDVLDAFIAVAEDDSSPHDAIFNVGTGVQSTLETVVATTRRLLDVKAEPRWGTMPNRSWDTSVWVADNSKLVESVGWRPRYSLEAGLARTIEWFRSNPELLRRYAAV